jgi:hypothetical protein
VFTDLLFYVACPDEQAFLSANRRFWIRPYHPRNPGGYTAKSIGLFDRDQALALVANPPKAAQQRPVAALIALVAPRCACCGADEHRAQLVKVTDGPWRCVDHRDRNPCAIEGCRRSTEARYLANDRWLCPEHWRRFVPPRSLRRRAYNAFFRKAKRFGWSPELNAQFWRFWFSLVKSARRRSVEGSIDKASIDRMFGWDRRGD